MKTLSAEITQEIINNACRYHKNACMVAEAVQEKYPGATHIWVDITRIAFTLSGVRYWFIPPQRVKEYILRFDEFGPKAIRPFSFTTAMRARVTPAGLYNTHPYWDNSKRNKTRYDPAKKKRKYATKVRIHGVVCSVPV